MKVGSIPASPHVPFRVRVTAPFDIQLLTEFGVAALGPFSVSRLEESDPATVKAQWGAFDAVVADAQSPWLQEGDAADAFTTTAVLIIETDPTPEVVLAWLQRGAQDVLARGAVNAQVLARHTRFAIERKRLEQSARNGYSTDAATGLPHREQLVEHMSHLLALREREPSAMAVLVLRIEGLSSTAARFGVEVSHLLRRKVAVRLRAGVRASDVVAAIGPESFAVLLGTLLSSADAQRVGEKLTESLLRPFVVGGSEVMVAVAIGIGHYPQDGAEAGRLLRRASALAAAAPAEGSGFASFHERAAGRDAANDD